MFSSFFSSKNQKLVKQWTIEHKQVLVLATKVREEYKQSKFYTAKKGLKELRKLMLNHLMTEDNELYKLTQDPKSLDMGIEESVNSFNESFHDTKPALMHFLKEYATDEAVLDDDFLKTFNKLLLALTKRFAFEEKMLYTSLNAS